MNCSCIFYMICVVSTVLHCKLTSTEETTHHNTCTCTLELSNSAFFTIAIVLDPIFTIDDSIAIECTINNFFS